MQNRKLLEVNLQMFNEGAASEGDVGSSPATQETESALPKVERRGSNRRKSGALSNVVYGIQEDAPETETTSPVAEGAEGNSKSGVTTTSDSKEARMAKFKEMIEGEFKDEYTEMFQSAFNRRFKDVKGLENSLTEQKPIIDMLMQRYKVTDGDMSKLLSAVEQDDQ